MVGGKKNKKEDEVEINEIEENIEINKLSDESDINIDEYVSTIDLSTIAPEFFNSLNIIYEYSLFYV
jgi:hypothetical protein